MIEAFWRGLARAGIEADHLQLAEILWLAGRLPPPPSPSTASAQGATPSISAAPYSIESPVNRPRTERVNEAVGLGVAPVGVYSAVQRAALVETATTSARRVFMPSAPALPNVIELSKSLKPMRRRRQSRTQLVLDEEATVTTYADFGVLSPIRRPEMERWFDVALVVDETPSMVIWRHTCAELFSALARHGAFRDVRRWSLLADTTTARLSNESGLVQNPRVLADPSSRRLILLATDCVSSAWDGTAIWQALADWGHSTPVALVCMLPERLWASTALGTPSISVSSVLPGVPNVLLDSEFLGWDPDLDTREPPIPVITLEEHPVRDWARVVMGAGGATAPAVRRPSKRPQTGSQNVRPSAAARVELFRAAASPTAYDLATYLSAVDLTLPVMRLIQGAMLPHSSPVHLAEFFLGGLIRRVTPSTAPTPPDEVRYEFYEGVRELLQRSVMKSEALKVLATVSGYLEKRTGQRVNFEALVPDRSGTERLPALARPFAEISEQLLAQYAPRALTSSTSSDPAPVPAEQPREVDAAPTVAPQILDRSIATLSGTVLRRAAERAATPSSIAELSRLPRPFPMDEAGPAQRTPTELTAYSVRVRLNAALVAEGNIRLYVSDSVGLVPQLAVDFPDLGGVKADRLVARKVREARKAAVDALRSLGVSRATREVVPLAGVADISGLAFFAERRSASPMLANGIELNPILNIRMVRGAPYRWAVRTLADFDVDKINFKAPTGTNVRALHEIPHPMPEGTGAPPLNRMPPAEQTLYTLIADVVAVKVLPSGDLKLVLTDPSDPSLTMIATLPDPEYIWSINPVLVEQMQSARAAVLAALGPELPTTAYRIGRPAVTAEVTGVGYFETVHGQTGIAPNGLTLHPVLAFRIVSTPPVSSPSAMVAPERAGRILQLLLRESTSGSTVGQLQLLLATPSSHDWADWLEAPSQAELYDKIVELSRAWSGAGYVQLVLQQGDRLSIVRAAIDRGKRAYPEAEWTGVIGRSARERRTIWLPDVNQDSAYIRAEPTTRSELAVPLVRSDGSGLLGVINCEWDRPVDLPPNETNWFEQLTLQIVSALEAKPAQLRAPLSYRMLVSSPLSGFATFSDPFEQHGRFVTSRAAHSINLTYPACMGRYLVTNESYLEFVHSGGYTNPLWWPDGPETTRFLHVTQDGQSSGPSTWPSSVGCRPGLERHPVAGVSYEEAMAYSRWLQSFHPPEAGWAWTLPDEDAWELAARSTDGYRYPWGNEFEPERCNSRESLIKSTSEVGAFPSGRSPNGCHDMAGNVWEFVIASDALPGGCVLRGGSFTNDRSEVASHLRLTDVARSHRPPDFGFRLAQVSGSTVSA